MMELEHASADLKLRHMREATAGYAVPSGACPTFRALFYALEQLERDLATHVSLEHDVLFPRAIDLVRRQGNLPA
jgi:regulator of cell morphogenesis and NO signaling